MHRSPRSRSSGSISIQLAPGGGCRPDSEDLASARVVESAEQNRVARIVLRRRRSSVPASVGSRADRRRAGLAHALATLNLRHPVWSSRSSTAASTPGIPTLPAIFGTTEPPTTASTADEDVRRHRPRRAWHAAGRYRRRDLEQQPGHRGGGVAGPPHGREVPRHPYPADVVYGAVGIFWAVITEREVITAAFGITMPSPVLGPAISSPTCAGVVVIAAAGNDGLDNDVFPTYPASYGGPPFNLPNVVSVMASKRPDYNAIVASIFATTRHGSRTTAGPACISPRRASTSSPRTRTSATPQWRAYSGTSAACAHVAYAAALVKALNPMSTPHDIRTHLVASVDWSPWLACVSRGRLSLDRAVRGPFVITSPMVGTSWPVGANVQVTWDNTYETPLATKVRILLSQNGLPRTRRSQPDNRTTGPASWRRRPCRSRRPD